MSISMLNLFGISPWIIFGLIVLALIISCIFSKIMRLLTVIILFVVISITGILSSFYNYQYFTLKGGVYGELELGANNITKVEFDRNKTFTYSLLGFSPTATTNVYECNSKFKEVTINLNEFNNMLLNNSECRLISKDTNFLKCSYSYSFLDDQYTVLCTDTLYFSLFTYENSMELRLQTKGGDSAVKYWNSFLIKNNFILSLSEIANDFPKNTDIEKDKEVTLYQINVNLEYVDLEYPCDENALVTLSIYDVNNNVFRSFTFINDGNKHVLNLRGFEAGQYMISFSTPSRYKGYINGDENLKYEILDLNDNTPTINWNITIYKYTTEGVIGGDQIN